MRDLYVWFSAMGWTAAVIFLGIIVLVGRKKDEG